MSSLRESYQHLLADLQLHLLQEYPHKAWLPVSHENFNYFKAQASSAPAKATPSPIAPAPVSPPLYPRKPPLVKPSAPPVTQEIKRQVAEPLPATPLVREPVGKAPPPDLSEIRKLVAEKHPKWEYVEPPPFRAKSAPVLILASKGDTLLQQIGQAIQNQLGKEVEILDADRKPDLDKRGLRLILLDEMALRNHPDLLKLYRPNLNTLAGIPVIVLTDLPSLSQDPQRKRAVWNLIKEILN